MRERTVLAWQSNEVKDNNVLFFKCLSGISHVAVVLRKYNTNENSSILIYILSQKDKNIE